MSSTYEVSATACKADGTLTKMARTVTAGGPKAAVATACAARKDKGAAFLRSIITVREHGALRCTGWVLVHDASGSQVHPWTPGCGFNLAGVPEAR